MHSEELKWNLESDGEEQYYEISGSGPLVNFYMFSSSSTIAEGTYSFTGEYQYTIGGLEEGSYTFDYSSDYEDEDLTQFTDGTLIVAKEGNEYQLSFSCTDEDGKTVMGNYSGSITFYSE